MRALAVFALCCAAAAAHAGVTLSVSVRSAQVKEIFYLTVRAEGTQIAAPVMPHATGLVINRTPTSSSQQTSVQFINGKVQQTSAQVWVYQAWATQAGTLEIPPVKVTIGGKDELSNPVTILIQEGSASPGAQPAPPGGQPAPGAQPGAPQQGQRMGQQRRNEQRPRPQVGVDQVMLLESRASKQSIYQGEAIVYEVSFCVLDEPGVIVRGDHGNALDFPSADGFYESELSREERIEMRDGLQYEVTRFTRTMFATRAGSLTIPSIHWSGRASAPTLIGSRAFAIERTTDPITIEVKPLPERPANFSGAVGRYSIRGEIEGGPVEQGVPKVFTVVIAGEGNVDAVPKPAMPPMDWCHVSEPQVSTNPLGGPLEFEKRFAYTLTPHKPEVQQVPEVSFVYFAPDIGNYKTISTMPVEVYVQPAKDAGPLVTAGGQSAPAAVDVKVLGSDIAPPVKARALAPASSSIPLHLAGFGAPPLVFAAGLALIRRRHRLATDTGYARGIRARSRSRKRLAEAARSQDPAEAIFKALVGFLGDKLNLQDAGMTSHDVREIMGLRGFPEEMVQEYVNVLRACERQRYSGAALSPQEATALHEAAARALDHLEQHTAGGRKL